MVSSQHPTTCPASRCEDEMDSTRKSRPYFVLSIYDGLYHMDFLSHPTNLPSRIALTYGLFAHGLPTYFRVSRPLLVQKLFSRLFIPWTYAK